MTAEISDLGFRVYEVHCGTHMLAAAAGNLHAARAAFDVLVEKYPGCEWVLRWGMFTPARHVPDG